MKWIVILIVVAVVAGIVLYMKENSYKNKKISIDKNTAVYASVCPKCGTMLSGKEKVCHTCGEVLK